VGGSCTFDTAAFALFIHEAFLSLSCYSAATGQSVLVSYLAVVLLPLLLPSYLSALLPPLAPPLLPAGAGLTGRNGPAKDASSNTVGSIGGVDVSRHFSYYAFDGAKGQSVWKHASGAFQKDLEASSDELRPQDDFRWALGRVTAQSSSGGP
jgi:hypothetical protein